MRIFAASAVIWIVIIVVSLLALGAGFFLLYLFVFRKISYKKQLKDLERKYSYLDALLIGTDSQYIHRLEIISRSNLLYIDKYNMYSKQFKVIFESDDKYAESLIKQLKALISNRQFKNIKKVFSDARRAINVFDENVNTLDQTLYSLIKPEEESRQEVMKLKESYRSVKQIFYANSVDLELVSNSFNKVFDKLDNKFVNFDELIEKANYDEANALIPTIRNVVEALEKILGEISNLCILTETLIPNQIEELISFYLDTKNSGIPLFNLSFDLNVENWKNRLVNCRSNLIDLKLNGVNEELTSIQDEISKMNDNIKKEIDGKNLFNEQCDILYTNVLNLEQSFLKICSILPELKKIYKIDEYSEEKINQLKENMNKLGNAKRSLDNCLHSATKQPYSLLQNKLNDLQKDYDLAFNDISNFKTYLDSLKTCSEEAHDLLFSYYDKFKEAETLLDSINIHVLKEKFQDEFNQGFELLNDIDSILKIMPIDVNSIKEKVDTLNKLANEMFNEINEQARLSKLAESAIVYSNRDRIHQSDVHQQLTVYENSFFAGDLDTAYHNAIDLFNKSHIEEDNNVKK